MFLPKDIGEMYGDMTKSNLLVFSVFPSPKFPIFGRIIDTKDVK
jgi:hypothetical protein